MFNRTKIYNNSFYTIIQADFDKNIYKVHLKGNSRKDNKGGYKYKSLLKVCFLDFAEVICTRSELDVRVCFYGNTCNINISLVHLTVNIYSFDS